MGVLIVAVFPLRGACQSTFPVEASRPTTLAPVSCMYCLLPPNSRTISELYWAPSVGIPALPDQLSSSLVKSDHRTFFPRSDDHLAFVDQKGALGVVPSTGTTAEVLGRALPPNFRTVGSLEGRLNRRTGPERRDDHHRRWVCNGCPCNFRGLSNGFGRPDEFPPLGEAVNFA